MAMVQTYDEFVTLYEANGGYGGSMCLMGPHQYSRQDVLCDQNLRVTSHTYGNSFNGLVAVNKDNHHYLNSNYYFHRDHKKNYNDRHQIYTSCAYSHYRLCHIEHNDRTFTEAALFANAFSNSNLGHELSCMFAFIHDYKTQQLTCPIILLERSKKIPRLIECLSLMFDVSKFVFLPDDAIWQCDTLHLFSSVNNNAFFNIYRFPSVIQDICYKATAKYQDTQIGELNPTHVFLVKNSEQKRIMAPFSMFTCPELLSALRERPNWIVINPEDLSMTFDRLVAILQRAKVIVTSTGSICYSHEPFFNHDAQWYFLHGTDVPYNTYQHKYMTIPSILEIPETHVPGLIHQFERRRLGISNLALSTESDWVILKTQHITQIEVAPLTLCDSWSQFTSDTIRNYESAHGIKVFSLQGLFYNTGIEIARDVKKALAHMEKLLQICVETNIGKITFGSPKSRHVETKEDKDAIAQLITAVARQFPQVIICVEPNARMYGCNFLTTLDDTIQFVQDIDEPNVKIQLDTGNLIMENDTLDRLRTCVYRIGAVHISDCQLGPLTSERHAEVAKFLHNIRYSGPISIEALSSKIQGGLNDIIDRAQTLYTPKNRNPSCLIGYTGFVGQNLRDQIYFDEYYNRSNLNDMRGKYCSTVYMAGMPGSMWHANNHPEEDAQALQLYQDVLAGIRAEQLILISSTNVYGNVRGVTETDVPSPTTIYGQNRCKLEHFIQHRFASYVIVRLPGLFGPHLKKNVIYDLTHNHRIQHINLTSTYQWYNVSHLGRDLIGLTENTNRHLVVNFSTPEIKTSELMGMTIIPLHKSENDLDSTFAPLIQSNYPILNQDTRSELEAYFKEAGIAVPRYNVYMINTPDYPCPYTHGLYIAKLLKGFKQNKCTAEELHTLDAVTDSSLNILVVSDHFKQGKTPQECTALASAFDRRFPTSNKIGWYWGEYHQLLSKYWIYTGQSSAESEPHWNDHRFVPTLGGCEECDMQMIDKSDALYDSCFIGTNYKHEWVSNLSKCYYYSHALPGSDGFLLGAPKLEIYRQSRIMLGFHSDANAEHGVVSDRVYEGLHACCVVLTDNKNAATLTHGIAEYVPSKQVLEERIHYYLSNPYECKRKAEHGLRFLQKRGTWYANARLFIHFLYLDQTS